MNQKTPLQVLTEIAGLELYDETENKYTGGWIDSRDRIINMARDCIRKPQPWDAVRVQQERVAEMAAESEISDQLLADAQAKLREWEEWADKAPTVDSQSLASAAAYYGWLQSAPFDPDRKTLPPAFAEQPVALDLVAFNKKHRSQKEIDAECDHLTQWGTTQESPNAVCECGAEIYPAMIGGILAKLAEMTAPCPFCGSKDVNPVNGYCGMGGSYERVICAGCLAEGPMSMHIDVAHPRRVRERAVTLWNQREPERGES